MRDVYGLIDKVTLILVLASLNSCGTKNFFDCDGGYARTQCVERTKDEDARIALDKGDLDKAVTLLSELVTDDPTNYQRYPLLAAAYAGRSGFDILNVVTANFGGSSSLIQTMTSFLPTPITRGSLYDQSLTDMDSSVKTLTAIPAEFRDSTSSDKYATSAVLQLTLYQAAYGVMLLNKFTYSTTAYDPSQLANMTAADAAAILAALAGAAGSTGAGSSATAAIAAIQAMPGSTDQEKIAAWSQAAR
jgi:hypothetical protein